MWEFLFAGTGMDSINNIPVNDPNPDFTLMELLNRNINKPMDWELVNPHPPAFDKSEYKDIMHLNSSKIPGIDTKATVISAHISTTSGAWPGHKPILKPI